MVVFDFGFLQFHKIGIAYGGNLEGDVAIGCF
jgi:hypothetical protein